jgi:hypothetical protein
MTCPRKVVQHKCAGTDNDLADYRGLRTLRHDVIQVFLGPKWMPPLFRLLAPTVLMFGVVNPLNWLLSALGLVGRSLKMVLVFAPVMMAAYIVAFAVRTERSGLLPTRQ